MRASKCSKQAERLLTADRFLTRREAARMLGLAEGTLAVWCCIGKKCAPPMRKHGRRCVYSERELLAWSETRRG
jgi:predicted DNA-binding transcriptional regulator AlpA